MLAILAWVLVSIAALLLVPLRLEVEAIPKQPPLLRLRVAWFFGLVRIRIRAGGDKQRKTRAPRKPRSKPTRSGAKRALTFARTAGVTDRLKRLLRDLIVSLHLQIERLHIELGFDDPADTGQSWAVLGPVSGWLLQRYGGAVVLVPSFTAPAFALEGRAQLTVVPLQLVGLVLGFLASPSILRGLYRTQRGG